MKMTRLIFAAIIFAAVMIWMKSKGRSPELVRIRIEPDDADRDTLRRLRRDAWERFHAAEYDN